MTFGLEVTKRIGVAFVVSVSETPEDAYVTPRECVYLMFRAHADSSEYAEALVDYLRTSLRAEECQADGRVVTWMFEDL